MDKAIADTVDWLLEPADIGVRYLALRDLVKAPPQETQKAKADAHRQGPINVILSKMNQQGYWVKPGPGYLPKYSSTVWSVILLAQLGASIESDGRVAIGASYILDHNLVNDGMFTLNGLPSGTIDCLQGNLCASLLDLGCTDPRLDKAFDWMARSVTGEGVAPITDKKATLRYYSGNCGPFFACGANDKHSCAWGAVAVMQAFSKLPVTKRTPLIERAIKIGVDFFFSIDPATADYPHGYAPKTSGNWWKFGFPNFYVADVLGIAEPLVRLGYGKDPRLSNTLKLIREKQDGQGRWFMEYDYTGKTWVDFGSKKQPNKWVTLRALRVLNAM
ncbi:MAG: nitrogen fixation protein NifH [Dehalococcoidales bacterium]|nr:nitrogen fixation protein NifH [Dehalococcoidales bacterium]